MRIKYLPVIVLIALVGISWAVSVNDAMAQSNHFQEVIGDAKHNESLGVDKVAMKKYKEAFKLKPERRELLQKYIGLAYDNELYDVYEASLLEYIQRFPSDGQAYIKLIEYYQSEEKYKRVIDVALKAKNNVKNANQFRSYYIDAKYQFDYISRSFQEANTFIGNTAKVKNNDNYGIINSKTNYIISPVYKNTEVYSEGKASVTNDGEVYFVDYAGDKILASEEKVQEAHPFIQGLSVIKKDNLYGYANSEFKLFDVKWDLATSYFNGLAAVKKDGKWAIRNYSREMVTDFIFDEVVYDENLICSYNNVIFVKKDGKFFLINEEGDQISEKTFDMAKPFLGKYAPVKISDKWGFINASGEIIIEPKYEDAYAFNLGLAPVKIENRWVFIDSQGNILIDDELEEAKSFASNGIAAVKKGDLWYYLQLVIYQ